MKKRTLSLTQKRSRYGLAFISPWIVGFVLFFATPLVLSVTFCFHKIIPTKTGYKLDFFGFENFSVALFKDTSFNKLLASSIGSLFMNVPIILVFSFFVALLLKQNFKGKAFAKAMFFFPVIMSSGLFVLLQSNFGQLVNQSNLQATMDSAAQSISFLQSLNLDKYLLEIGVPDKLIVLITGPINQIYSVITNSGIQIFIFLAGLNSISPALYEASYIEGASGWEAFWKITFPMMVPMILVNTVYSIIDSFTSLTNQVMDYVYKLAFTDYNFGLSSAMSWIYFIILALIMGLVGWLITRKAFYYI